MAKKPGDFLSLLINDDCFYTGWCPPVILVGGLEHVCFSIYPLVNCYITMERSTMLFMGKLTISTGPFSIANCNKLPEGK